MMRSESTLCSCVYTHTRTPLIFSPLSIHLRPSSLQSICHPRLLPLMTVLALFHHFCLAGMSFFIYAGFVWFRGHSGTYFFPLSPLSLPVCSFTSASSSSLTPLPLPFISPDEASIKLQMWRAEENKMGQSVNSWHLGLALSARTEWTVVTLVWSVLFMPFKVTASTRLLWSKEYTNTSWHRPEPHYYIWVTSSLQVFLV